MQHGRECRLVIGKSEEGTNGREMQIGEGADEIAEMLPRS